MPNHPDPSPKPRKPRLGQPDAIADASTRLIGFDVNSPVVRKLINDLCEMITLNRKETVCLPTSTNDVDHDDYLNPNCTCGKPMWQVGPIYCPVHKTTTYPLKFR